MTGFWIRFCKSTSPYTFVVFIFQIPCCSYDFILASYSEHIFNIFRAISNIYDERWKLQICESILWPFSGHQGQRINSRFIRKVLFVQFDSFTEVITWNISVNASLWKMSETLARITSQNIILKSNVGIRQENYLIFYFFEPTVLRF